MSELILLLFFLAIVYLIFIYWVKYSKKKWSTQDQRFFANNWQKIMNESDLKHKILDADKLLDTMLRKRGYSGSLGDKLKSKKTLFSDIDGLWSAHKLRNKIAHEVDFQINAKTAGAALKSFEKAFKDLGLL